MKNAHNTQYSIRYTLYAILVILFCTILPQAAQAATYYVATDGNDLASGDTTHPWKTIARAMTQYTGAGTPKVISGDTIKIRTGNYAGYIEQYGEAVNRTDWVTYEADTGCNPVFVGGGPGFSPGISSRGVVGVSKNSYLRFRGITVDVPNFGETAIYLRDVNYIQFYDMNIIGAGYTGGDHSSGILLQDVSHVTIDGCTIYGDGPGIGEGTSSSGISFEGFGKGFEYGIWGYGNAKDVGITITNCNVWSCHTGIMISGSGWNVSNNDIHHMTIDGIVLDKINTVASGLTDPVVISNNHIHTMIAYQGGHNDGIQGYAFETNHIIIRGNIINHMDGDAMFLKGGIAGETNTDWLIENNLVYDTMGGQIHSQTVRLYNCDDATFRNNTIYGTVTGETEGTPPTKMTYSVFSNNIIQKLALNTISGPGKGTIVKYENNNIINTVLYGMESFVFGSNTVLLNSDLAYEALFNNFDSNDFRLASGSTAIGFADSAYAPITDILGNTRDVTPDAGCYEYGATTFLYGDVNVDAKVTPYDAALAAHIAVGLAHPDIKKPEAAEVDGIGSVSANDASLIAQKAVGLIDKFPIEQ